jgi:single-stranded DNA-binding protein
MFDAIMLGNVVGNPEIKVTTNGSELISFTVAHNETVKNGDVYEKVVGPNGGNVVTFYDVAIFSNSPLYAAAGDLVKGAFIKIEGAVARRDYVNKEGVAGTGWNMKFVKSISVVAKKSDSAAPAGAVAAVVEVAEVPF